MTGRLFRIFHSLHDNGQAWGSMLTWVGLVVFCAASPISIAATNIAWGVALAGLLVHALSRDDRFASLARGTDLDAPLACFVLASLLAVLHSLDLSIDWLQCFPVPGNSSYSVINDRPLAVINSRMIQS